MKVFPGNITKKNSNRNGRNYHNSSIQLPTHHPTGIFADPQYDMQIFDFTEMKFISVKVHRGGKDEYRLRIYEFL